ATILVGWPACHCRISQKLIAMLGRQTTSGRTADPGAKGQHSLILHGISVGRRRLTLARSAEPFNESAAQVKRLISRDRKEFLGNDLDILDKYQTEFGEAPAGPSKSSDQPAAIAPVKPVQPAKRALPADNPFGKPVNATPFPKPPPPPKSSMEPVGLRPDMGPDPIVKEKAFSLLENITLTQVVIVISFTLIIALMLSTFFFVLKVGGVRLNGI
ncbi:hypothetical protein QJQ45_021487, partial [Haematococcus lacustris]